MFSYIGLRYLQFNDHAEVGNSYDYDQKLDHFNPNDNRTFKQKFFVCMDFVKEKFDSAVLYIGGESTLTEGSVVNGAHRELAEKLNAPIFGLEHRYFGYSIPFDNLELDKLQYLTIEQALADLASFCDFIKSYPKHGDDVKIVVVGGSYPGTLASLFRLKYPHKTAAAWSSSAPLDVRNDFPEYDAYLAEQLDQYEGCLSKTKTAFDMLDEMIKSGDAEKIKKLRQDFRIDNRTDDVSSLYVIVDVLAVMIQYKLRYTFLDDYCAATLNTTDPYETYKEHFNIVIDKRGDDTYNFDLYSAKNTDISSGFANSRSWSYMTCHEVGWFQTDSGKLRSSLLNLTYFEKFCKDVFGFEKLADTDDVMRRYGGLNPRQTRVYFTNGDVDPWSTIGIRDGDESIERYSVLIHGASHCADLSTYDLNKELVDARNDVINRMEKWAVSTSCNSSCVHGVCRGDLCVCDENWTGDKCDVHLLPYLYFYITIGVACFIILVLLIALIVSAKKSRKNNSYVNIS